MSSSFSVGNDVMDSRFKAVKMKRATGSSLDLHTGAIQASMLSHHAIAYKSIVTNRSTEMIPAGYSGGFRIIPAGTSDEASTSSGTIPSVNSGCGLLITTVPGLENETGMNVVWSSEEQTILEEGLVKYAELESINRYIKIARLLPDKTVRDVAFRCRWMTKKESVKRRKPNDVYAGKKIKERQERPLGFPSTVNIASASQQRISSYSFPMHQKENNLHNTYEGLNRTRNLLEVNGQIFYQIAANLLTFKLQENIHLLHHTRNNLTAILNDMRETPGIMSQMPPLPVSINEDLANTILPLAPQPLMFGNPMNFSLKHEAGC